MAKSIQRKTERSPEELARLKALREQYQREKPSIADLEARGAEFTTLGEVILLRCLAAELKAERERQGLTPEQLAAKLNMDPATLASIEAGLVSKLRLGILCQIASGLGKSVSCVLVEKAA
jgi:ribosome-binding protein aMBF1 (putative translation factor)